MYPKLYTDLFRQFDKTPIVFVGMPFSKNFQPRWQKIIKPAIKECKLKPYRVDQKVVSDSIPTDILNAIATAKYLLFDISNDKAGCPNPNVMYELGIAHANRMPEEVIMIRDNSSEKAPFDIKHIRWNTYSPTALKKSISIIKRLLRVAQKQVNLTKDLIIKKVILSLEPDAISFLQVIRDWPVDGFDFCPFDPDRKGLYGLPHKDCSENYLRLIARNLIVLGVLKAAPPLPPQDRIYGGTPEYYLTNLGKALMAHIPDLPNSKTIKSKQ